MSQKAWHYGITPTYTAVDRLIVTGRVYVWGYMFDATADGGAVSLYDGQDTVTGQLKCHTTGWATDPNTVMFGVPVCFERGIYADLGANVSDLTVLWSHNEPTVEELTSE